MLIAMIRSGTAFDGDVPIRSWQRKQWLHQVPATLAGATCRCGSCPSIHLEDEHGSIPTIGARVVLTAATRNAIVLLFIDDDRPSYLELAPIGDEGIEHFPSVRDLLTDP